MCVCCNLSTTYYPRQQKFLQEIRIEGHSIVYNRAHIFDSRSAISPDSPWWAWQSTFSFLKQSLPGLISVPNLCDLSQTTQLYMYTGGVKNWNMSMWTAHNLIILIQSKVHRLWKFVSDPSSTPWKPTHKQIKTVTKTWNSALSVVIRAVPCNTVC